MESEAKIYYLILAKHYLWFMIKNSTNINLTHGEKLMILVRRSGLSMADLAEKMGYTRTYIPKLYELEEFNQRQLHAIAKALNVPESTFTDDFDNNYPDAQDIDVMQERITIDPSICHGKPTIRGSRLLVTTILELLSSGMSHDEIIADYPGLEEQDILACLEFATRLAQFKTLTLDSVA